MRFRLNGRVVHLKPKGITHGNVLLSYTTLPFLNPNPDVLKGHTNRWECRYIAESFVRRGYAVDIIDIHNRSFIPKKPYAYCIDAEENLGRLAPLLHKDCVKIFYVNMQHWQANNTAEQTRLNDFEKRTGIKPEPERTVRPNESAEKADVLLLLGNAVTERTYAHIKKPLYRLPISTAFTYPPPEQKDSEQARKSFVWLGGGGPIHKGVDLLIEAFSEMPEYTLHLCGKYMNESIELAYKNELRLPNIKSHGVMDLGSDAFAAIVENSVAVLSASCAEGQSGATVTGMHAGLIPVISKETGIDTEDFGITLETTAIQTIQDAVRSMANESASYLRERAIKTWEYARAHHTRETFAAAFDAFLDTLKT